MLESEPPELLCLLDLFVRRDGASPLLSGKVALGVRTETRVHWWIAELESNRVHSRITTELERDVDAALMLTAEDAEAVLQGQPARDAKGFGDAALMKAVMNRYLKNRDLLAIRSGDAPMKKRPRGTRNGPI